MLSDGDSCHGHDYQHAANEKIAGICCRICAILELKKEEEITRVCAGNNTLGIIKVRARGQPREQKYVAALESTRKLAVTTVTLRDKTYAAINRAMGESLVTANTTKLPPPRFSNSQHFATYLNNSTTTKKFHSNLVGNQFYDLRIT